jgi:hypothetical protein
MHDFVEVRKGLPKSLVTHGGADGGADVDDHRSQAGQDNAVGGSTRHAFEGLGQQCVAVRRLHGVLPKPRVQSGSVLRQQELRQISKFKINIILISTSKQRRVIEIIWATIF